jgi:hypothetical protein
MKIRIKETDDFGNNTVPAGYNQPQFGVGTATQVPPGPDQKLVAATAATTPNGIDPLNSGFSVGGANDPLAEFEAGKDNPAGMDIGGGKPTPPVNAPSHPPMSSMKEEEPVNEGVNPFGEEENPFGENELQSFESVDALPAFEDISNDPALAALPVDASGVIEPIVVPDDIIVEPELGAIPDVALPFEEPIVEIDEDDVDIQIPENVFENDTIPESIPVMESFYLPENQSVIVSKGDQIFVLGHVREEFTPKFAESVFTRALKSLCESKGGGNVMVTGDKKEKVAIVGRSMLVEVAKDWRLPGTSVIFEAHDLLQIVSAKPVREAEKDEEDDDEPKGEGKKKETDAKAKEEAELEKLKKEAYLANKRWREAEQKRKEGDGKDKSDDDEDEDDPEKKAKKERAEREAAQIERQKSGGYI